MKFLILNAASMKGHVIAIHLRDKGHFIDAYSERSITGLNTITGSYKDIELLSKVLTEGEYDAVVNCYSVINQNAQENKSDAVFVNSYLPHLLAELTATLKTKVVHISTDCIYSGLKGAYTEMDAADGTSFYARTKALGELRDDKNVTLRNSIIGPDEDPQGIGLFNWFMKQKGTIKGYTKAIWSGVTSIELAKIIEAAVNQNVHGLFNMCHETPIDKYNLLLLFNRYFNNNALNIVTDDSFASDKSLKRTNFDFTYEVPDYDTMMKEMKTWIMEHKELYPQYN